MALSEEQAVALTFLGYLVLPLALILLAWLVKFLLRRVFKVRGADDSGGEGEG